MNSETPEMVWILRHAETTAPYVFNGYESDVPLSALGVAQSEAVAEWFLPLRPTAVVSSAMTRAIQTAKPIADRCDIPSTVERDLHERKIGAMAGQAFSLTHGPWPDTVKAWSDGNSAFTTAGAESFEELTARILPAWRRVIAGHSGGRVVIVAHGIVVKVLLLNLLEGGDPRAWGKIGSIRNVAVTGLKPSPRGWHADPLLYLPESVDSLTTDFPSLPILRSVG